MLFYRVSFHKASDGGHPLIMIFMQNLSTLEQYRNENRP